MVKKKTSTPSPKDDALAELQQQVDNLTTALQRERADALNLRRRYEEQLTSARSGAKVSLVKELLPVIDNFERSLKHIPFDLSSNEYIKGIAGIVRQFEKTLKDMGIERVPGVGQPFDPRYHEAVSMEEGEDGQEIVSEELQPGYRLGDVIIRPAIVKVKQ